MASVQLQPTFSLPQKFENLNFNHGYESTSSSPSSSDSMSTPSTPDSPPVAIPIEVHYITKDDHDQVLRFLQTYFFTDEPLNCYLQLINEKEPRCYELEEYALKELDNGLSLKAVIDGKIVGVCLNGFLERGYIEEIGPVDCKHKNFAKILNLLDRVSIDSNVFQYFPGCDKAITVKIVAVNNEYRGRGIAKELMAKTRDIAKEQNCGFMTVDCSSHFTAMALKKLGFTKVWGLNYADYKVDGEVVFTPAPPHAAVTVYTQKVE